MAMTPVYNEVNRIQVGSPVPIGGTEQDRAMSEAHDALGKAIFDLGNAMDTGKDDKAQFARQGKIAADMYAMELMKNEQLVRQNGDMQDPTGVDTHGQIVGMTEAFKEKLANQLDPRALSYFQEGAADALRQQTPNFLKTGVAGNETRIKSEQDALFNGINEKTKMDPSVLPISLLEIELAVEQDPQVSVAGKQAEIRRRQASAIMSLSEKFRNDGQDGDLSAFDKSKAVLQQYASIIDPKDVGNETKEVIEARYSTTSRFRTDIDWNIKEKERKEKEVYAANFRKVSEMFSKASKPTDFLLADKAGRELVNKNLMTEEQLTQAKNGPKYTMELGDDLFESKVINQLMQEKGAFVVQNKQSAVQQINDQFFKKHLISADRHAKLIELANTLRNNKVDKERYENIRSFGAIFDGITKESITKPGDDAFKQELVIKARTLGAQFKKEALATNGDVETIFNKYMSRYDVGLTTKNTTAKSIPSTPQAAQVNKATVEDYMSVLKQRVIKAKKSGDVIEQQRANDALSKAIERTKGN